MTNKKVVKFKKPMNINIGIVIFVVLFLYLIIEIVTSLNKVTPSVYCVESSYIDNNFYVTGIALRKEQLITANKSGYVSYYIRDGERVGKNDTIYTLDETGSVYKYLAENAGDSVKLTKKDYKTINKQINLYRASYSDDNFSGTYNFKYDMENTVLELSNEILIEEATAKDKDFANTFQMVPAEVSGIVTYYEDGYETFSPEDASKDAFDIKKYKKVTLKTGEIIQEGTPVYKVVTEDDWNIIAPLTDEQKYALDDKQVVTITIDNFNYKVDCNFKIIAKTDGYYINIIMNKLMVDFVNERFLDVCIQVDTPRGLKVPNSSVVTVDTYKVPKGYMSGGSNSTGATKLNVRTLDENGELSVTQISPVIYFKDEKYYYISKTSVDSDAILVKNNSEKTISVSELNSHSFEGVFSANKGTASFKIIKILNEKDDFCIVQEGMDYSISLYDYILLDGEDVVEGQIIY